MRSRVVPGKSSTTATRSPIIRLKKVDLPTFGRPTTATSGFIIGAPLFNPFLIVLRLIISHCGLCSTELWYALVGVNWCTPRGAIVGRTAAHDVAVKLLDSAADWSNSPIANGTVIHADDGSNLCPCATHEDFVGDVDLGTVYLPLAGDTTKFASCQLHHRIAGDTKKYVLGRSRRYKFTIDQQENVFCAAFRDMALVS